MKINTIYGEMDDSELIKTTGELDNETETTSWVEYRLPESTEIVHRSVHMTLKKSLFALGEAAQL